MKNEPSNVQWLLMAFTGDVMRAVAWAREQRISEKTIVAELRRLAHLIELYRRD